MKTIILIRHSKADKNIGNNKTHPLTNQGIEKAKHFFENPCFDHINKIYTSPYLRAIQTAQILSKNINIDHRLIERIIGNSQTAHISQWKKQYDDHNYKNINGESLNEVKERMTICIQEIIENTKENEKVCIISHATSICSYLLNFCEIQVTDEINRIRKITFNHKIILKDRIQTPSCFILNIENNKIVDIKYFS